MAEPMTPEQARSAVPEPPLAGTLMNVAEPAEAEAPLLNVAEGGPTYTPEEASTEAEKHNYALGDKSPGASTINTALLSGQEDSFRASIATINAIEDRMTRQKKLDQYLNEFHTGEFKKEDVDYAKSLIVDEGVPPEFVLEREMAKKLSGELDAATEKDIPDDPGLVSPTAVAANPWESGQKMLEFQQIGNKVWQDYAKKHSQTSWAATTVDFLEQMVPYLSAYRMTNIIPGTKASNIFTGQNMEEARQQLWLSKTPEEFKAKLEAAMGPLFAANEIDAMTFLGYMMEPSSMVRGMMDIVNPLDTALTFTPATLLKGAKATAGAAARVASGTADVARAMRVPGFSKTRILDAAGSINAAHDLAIDNLKAEINRSGVRPNSFREIEGNIDPLMNPETVVGGSYGFLSREKARRLLLEMKERATSLIAATVLDPVKIDRLASDPALKQAMNAAEEAWNLQLPQLSNRTLFVRHATSAEDTVQGVHVAEIGVGTADVGMYDTAAEAVTDIRNMGLLNASVRVGGGKFYISLKKVMPETVDNVRDHLATPTTSKPPVNAVNMYAKFIRSQDYLLDKDTVKDMKTAQFGASNLIELMKKEAAAIPALDKGSRKKLSDFLQYERVAPSVEKAGTVGQTSKTLGEFESRWYQKYGTVPTDGETSAYFAFVQINNNDLLLRNMGLLRDKHRAGIENFSFKYKTPQATYTAKEIEGRTVAELPSRNAEDAGVFVLNADGSPLTITNKNGKTTTGNYWRLRNAGATFREATGNGKYRIIQLSKLGEDQLRNLPGMDGIMPKGRVRFLMVPEAQAVPLRFWQIPHRSGSHIQYPMTGSKVVQPNISSLGKDEIKHTYYGDRTMYYQAVHADAETLAARTEVARKMLIEVKARRTKASELQKYLRDNLPGMNLRRFMSSFTGKNAMFHLDHPFVATRMGETSYDAHRLVDRYPGLTKESDSEYNMYKGFDLEYTMERDMPLNTFNNKGTSSNPLYNLEPAPMLDPMPTIERAVGDAMRGRYLDDLKIKNSEKFIQLFSSVLDPSIPLSELRRDPIYHMVNPQWRKVVTGEERKTLAAAKNYQKAQMDFFRVKDDLGKDIDYAQYKLMQTFYKGEVPGAKTRWLISKISHPFDFFRQIAFDAHLGLFSPTQFFKQMNTMAHVAALSNPLEAANSLAAGLYMRGLFMNPKPEMVAYAAKNATKWGWKEAEFKEAFEALRRSGFWHVGREVSQLNNYVDATMFEGKMGKFLNWGRTPFKLGDQLPRLAAFNVSYRAWRKANPAKELTDRVVGDLISRADDLTVNMSAASNARMQQGFAGVFTQFMGYQARMAEQFLGKKLTGSEKRRLFGTYSALYGVPVAGAGTIGLWPISETFKEWQLDNPNIADVVDYNVFTKAAAEGIPGTIIEVLTGEAYNFGDAYGPAGIQILEDVIDGDKESTAYMAGVSGSFVHDMFFSTEPFLMMLMDTTRGDGEFYSPSMQDVVDFLKPISTVNILDRIYHGLAWGEALTKSGAPIDELSPWEAVLGPILGVQPERIMETFLKLDNNKDRKDFQDRMKTEAVKHFRRGFRYHAEDKFDDGSNEFRKAVMFMTSARFNPVERAAVIQEAAKGYKSLLLEVGKAYAEGSPEKMQYWIGQLRKKGAQ